MSASRISAVAVELDLAVELLKISEIRRNQVFVDKWMDSSLFSPFCGCLFFESFTASSALSYSESELAILAGTREVQNQNNPIVIATT